MNRSIFSFDNTRIEIVGVNAVGVIILDYEFKNYYVIMHDKIIDKYIILDLPETGEIKCKELYTHRGSRINNSTNSMGVDYKCF
jgi:hypothetical protein